MGLFKKVDSSKRGTIGMDDWIQYSFKHIEEKVKTMHKETLDFGDLPKSGKDKFLAFLETATSDKKSREHTELYANAPRVLGLAPKSTDMFSSDAERLTSRKKL